MREPDYSRSIPSGTPYRSVASSPHTLMKMDVAWIIMNRRCRALYSGEGDGDVDGEVGEAGLVSCFLSFISGNIVLAFISSRFIRILTTGVMFVFVCIHTLHPFSFNRTRRQRPEENQIDQSRQRHKCHCCVDIVKTQTRWYIQT